MVTRVRTIGGRVDIGGAFGSGDRQKTTIRRIDLLSEGPIAGLVDGERSVYIDDTPLVDAAGEDNFKGVAYHLLNGFDDQPYIPGFGRPVRQVSVNRPLKFETPWIQSIPDVDISAVVVNVVYPRGLSKIEDNGSQKSQSVELEFDLKFEGEEEWEPYAKATSTGRSTSSLQQSFRVELKPYRDARDGMRGLGSIQIRVRRTTAESSDFKVANESTISKINLVSDDRVTYANSAVIGTTIDGDSFGGGSLQRMSWLIEGLMVRIPSNYDPQSRTYDGEWDGLFKPELHYTNNPAWLLYDILTHDRYGLGRALDERQINRRDFYRAARYNDELVPTGIGKKMEPRFACNARFDQKVHAFEFLSIVASSFHARLYWNGRAYGLWQDRPSTETTMLVTNYNAVDGRFQYEDVGPAEKPNIVEVAWIDPDNAWRPAIERVIDERAVQEAGPRVLRRQVVGITSKSRARREGLWALLTDLNEKQTITYEAGPDHWLLRPGELILVADRHQNDSVAGRLEEVSGSPGAVVLDLDQPIGSPAAGTMMWVSDSMGRIQTAEVEALSPTRVRLDIPSLPLPGAQWAVATPDDIPPRLFRVLSVAQRGVGSFQITAVAHYPEKYALVDAQDAKFESVTTEEPEPRRVPIEDFKKEETLVRRQGKVVAQASLSWSPVPDARVGGYQIRLRGPGDDGFILRPGIVGREEAEFTITDAEDGLWRIGISAVDRNDVPSAVEHVEEFTIEGLATPPSTPTGVQADLSGDSIRLLWNQIPDLDRDYYQLRVSYAASPTWETATPVDGGSQIRDTWFVRPRDLGTYFLKAVDTGGRESVEAARLDTLGIIGFGDDTALVGGYFRPDDSGLRELIEDEVPEAETQPEGKRTDDWPSGLVTSFKRDIFGSMSNAASVPYSTPEEREAALLPRYLPLTPFRSDSLGFTLFGSRPPTLSSRGYGSPDGLPTTLGFYFSPEGLGLRTREGRFSLLGPGILREDLDAWRATDAPFLPPAFDAPRPYASSMTDVDEPLVTDFMKASDPDDPDFDELNFGHTRTNGVAVDGVLTTRGNGRVVDWLDLGFGESVVFHAGYARRDPANDIVFNGRRYPAAQPRLNSTESRDGSDAGDMSSVSVDSWRDDLLYTTRNRDPDRFPIDDFPEVTFLRSRVSRPVPAEGRGSPDFGEVRPHYNLMANRDLEPGEDIPLEEAELVGFGRGVRSDLHIALPLIRWSDSGQNVKVRLQAQIDYETFFIDDITDFEKRVAEFITYERDGEQVRERNTRRGSGGAPLPDLPRVEGSYQVPMTSLSSLIYRSADPKFPYHHRIVPFEGEVEGVGIRPAFLWSPGGRFHAGFNIFDVATSSRVAVNDRRSTNAIFQNNPRVGQWLGYFSFYGVRVKAIRLMVLDAFRSAKSRMPVAFDPASVDADGFAMVVFSRAFGTTPSSLTTNSSLEVETRDLTPEGFKFRLLRGGVPAAGSMTYEAIGRGVVQKVRL